MGDCTDRYAFTAFGELLHHEGADPNAYLFAGEMLDPNSGFYYNRARWMDPEAGRFASLDPFGGLPEAPLSLHKYLYSSADGVNSSDPSGESNLFSFAITGAIIGLIGGIIIGGLIGGLQTRSWKGAVVGALHGGATGLAFGAVMGAIAAVSATLFAVTAAAAFGFQLGTTVQLLQDHTIRPEVKVVLVLTLILAAYGFRAGAIPARAPVRATAAIQNYRISGLAAQDRVAAFLIRNGVDVVGQGVYGRVLGGLRRELDIVIRDSTGRLHALEIKSGRTGRPDSQHLKDMWLNRFGARAFGKRAREAGIEGEIIETTTTVYWDG